ncbi:hypothetical protein KKE34_02705 [Patescibacteria group bacterium]|nr:hypothetical protein [Patescibacteria group bacterium]MBU1885499.1 hypothetical protein [Patescibacteria group bacterium]
MPKAIKWLIFLFSLVSVWLVVINTSYIFAEDPVTTLQREIDELEHLKKLSVNATKPLEEELSGLESRIISARNGIATAKNKSIELAADIKDREEELTIQYHILSKRIAQQYKRSRTFSPFMTFLATQDAAKFTKDMAYRSSIKAQDNRLIEGISQDIGQLEADRVQLEQDQVKLAALEKQLDEQADFFRVEIKGAKDYQQELSGKIAALSARQQEIMSEKSGTFKTTVGDVPPADDPASRPDYNPGFSPAFAAFSFGAPHFKGMSQYGAYGRAKSGQDAETILKAYYGSSIELKKDYLSETIVLGRYVQVNGKLELICDQGSVDLETYAKRIYEVPGSWGDDGGMEALKAQAIAAKSYALATVKNRGCICMTESCQVYKSVNKGGKWEEAVNATSGWVMIANGSPLWAQYAASSGGYQESYSSSYNSGYSTPGFWDTKNGQSGWTSQAYEKISGSPWFYKAWYKRRSGDSCGSSHPWLTSSEMADIINAWVILVKHGQSDDRIGAIGPCWGGNPYSINELRNKADSLSGGYSSVSGVSVTYANNGVTANVTFQTDKGSVTINGNDFYKMFNLRAPGAVSLKSGLFNIEKK